MSKATLVAYNGARLVNREQLDAVPVPPSTATYFPLPHGQVIDTVARSVQDAGFEIRNTQFALSRGDARMFATMELATALVSGVSLAIGIRSSMDKSFPLGLIGGQKVFVCSNLAFRSDLIHIRRKHTRNGATRFQEAIGQAVQTLDSFRKVEGERIRCFQLRDINDVTAESLTVRAYERGIISHRQLPDVLKHWRTPEHEEFQDRTLWSWANAVTSALSSVGKSNPQRYCGLTMSLQGLLGEAAGLPSATEVDHTTAA